MAVQDRVVDRQALLALCIAVARHSLVVAQAGELVAVEKADHRAAREQASAWKLALARHRSVVAQEQALIAAAVVEQEVWSLVSDFPCPASAPPSYALF